jgi:hypothetical protein
VPRHLLPSVASSRERGRPHPMLTLALAGYCRESGDRPAWAGPEVAAAARQIERLGARAAIAVALDAAEPLAA